MLFFALPDYLSPISSNLRPERLGQRMINEVEVEDAREQRSARLLTAATPTTDLRVTHALLNTQRRLVSLKGTRLTCDQAHSKSRLSILTSLHAKMLQAAPGTHRKLSLGTQWGLLCIVHV